MKNLLISKSRTIVSKKRFDRVWELSRKSGIAFDLPFSVVRIGYSRWKEGKSTARAAYDFFGVELVTAGNVVYTMEGREFLVETGSVFLKHPGRPHEYHTGPAGYACKRYINLAGPKLAEIIDTLHLSSLPYVQIRDPAALTNSIKQAAIVLCVQQGNYSLNLSALAFGILLQVSQSTLAADYPPSVYAAIEYMHRHISKQIKVSRLADHAGMSVTHFYRIFEQSVGMAPITFFRLQKMKFAEDLLKHTGHPIKTIAAMVGIENQLAFSTLFRKHAGISPREFRYQSQTPSDK
jgi:AraC-like DNA-binding protein